MQQLSTCLRKPFAKFLLDNPHTSVLIRDFRQRLLDNRRLLILGGLLRDILIYEIHNRYIPLEDIDLVIQGKHLDKNTMLQFFAGHPSVVNVWGNRFGGLTVLLPRRNAKIGVWHIDETHSLVLQNKNKTIHELINSVIFSMNAICMDFETSETFESGAVAAIESQVIEFKSKFMHHEEIQAARALWYHFKLNFALSPSVENFVRTALSKNETESILEILKEKAGDDYNAAIRYISERYLKYGGPRYGCW